MIEAKDNERKVFIYQNFHREMNESSDYDMVINAKSFTLDEMAEIVFNTYEKKAGILVKVYE